LGSSPTRRVASGSHSKRGVTATTDASTPANGDPTSAPSVVRVVPSLKAFERRPRSLATHSGPRLVVGELSEQDLTELFYVREALEGMAARLAAENATPSEIAQIRELLDDMEIVSRRGDLSALRRLSGVFHQLVCRAAHNNRLLQSRCGQFDCDCGVDACASSAVRGGVGGLL
jgi:FCD domain-containing protein